MAPGTRILWISKIFSSTKKKMKKKKKKPSAFYKFCKETSIDGMHYIFPKNPRPYWPRIVWGFLLLSVLSFLIYQCKITADLYFGYDVIVSYSYDRKDEIEFPAITICSETLFRRSMVGSNPLFMYYATEYYGQKEGTYEDTLEENIKTCEYNNSYINHMPYDTLNMMFNEGLNAFLKLTSATSKDSVVKCWWLEKEIPCSEIFVDHLTDYGMCFTFNPANSTNYVLNTLMGIKPDVRPMKTNVKFVAKSAYQRTSIKFLLNAQLDEYCGTFRKWTGVGFRMHIHDRKKFAVASQANLFIYPGYVYNFALETTNYHRKTEFLEYCSSTLKLKNAKHAEDEYTQVACYLKCMIEVVWNYCRCVPAHLVGRVKEVSKLLGIDARENQLCLDTKFYCMRDVQMRLYVLDGLAQNCLECNGPCNYINSEYHISNSRLPSDAVKVLAPNSSYGTDEKDQLNFVILNFHFQSMVYPTIIEKQKFTATDSLIYIGNAMGLFLGVSAISIFEPIFYIFLNLSATCSMLGAIFSKLWQKIPIITGDRVYEIRKRSRAVSISLYGKETPTFLQMRRKRSRQRTIPQLILVTEKTMTSQV